MDFGYFGCLFVVFHRLVKTLALLQGSPASAVSVYFVLYIYTVFIVKEQAISLHV